MVDARVKREAVFLAVAAPVERDDDETGLPCGRLPRRAGSR
jgi:hypothetical protein